MTVMKSKRTQMQNIKTEMTTKTPKKVTSTLVVPMLMTAQNITMKIEKNSKQI